MIRTLTIAGACLALSAQSVYAQTANAPDLAADIDGQVGDVVKLSGPVAVAAPDAQLKADSLYRTDAVLSVPVAFARTARLENELHASTGEKWGWDNDVVMPAGTVLYHATFRHLASASTPVEAWCADQAYTRGVFHDKTSHGMYCIARNTDGKAVGLYGVTSAVGLIGAGYYPDKAQVLAYALSPEHSLPFDYPAITETPLPSPPLTLSLKVAVDGKAGTVTAAWAIVETGDALAPGVVWSAPAVMDGNHIRVVLGAHTVSMDYVPQSKSVTHVAVEDGVPGQTVTVGLPFYYWLPYQMAQGAQTAPAQAVVDTPWQFGAEHVKPETVSLATGALAKNDVLLTATAQLGARYKLTAPLMAWGHNAGAPTGTAVYAASEVRRAPEGTLYRNDFWCLEPGNRGYECVPATPSEGPGGQGAGQGWRLSPLSADVYEGAYVTPYRPEFLNVGYRPVAVTADPDPAPGDDTVQMRISDIQAGYVQVAMGLLGDGKFQAARNFTFVFDAKGDAVIPLWDRLVHLHHDGKTVIVTGIEAKAGDGPQIEGAR